VRVGGLILADNVISHDVSAYQAVVRARHDLETVTIPIDRGVEFTLKTA
jgi:caffeoyl-CoA O-methyltransferase